MDTEVGMDVDIDIDRYRYVVVFINWAVPSKGVVQLL